MTEHKNIAAALAQAQSEMGKAIKDSNNPHFRSKYADLGNVMDACLPALNKHGIAVFQPAGADDRGEFVATVLLHTSGEKLECRVPLLVNKNDMQGYGSAVTYARRYGLMCMAGIAPEDDDGNAAAKAPPPAQQAKPAQAAKPAQPAPRDPVKIADWLIASIEKCQSVDAIDSLLGPDAKASEAWDWLALEASAQAERVRVSEQAKRTELKTKAPF
jgi:hypothetical protein